MPRDQTQPGSFSRGRKEPGNEVGQVVVLRVTAKKNPWISTVSGYILGHLTASKIAVKIFTLFTFYGEFSGCFPLEVNPTVNFCYGFL